MLKVIARLLLAIIPLFCFAALAQSATTPGGEFGPQWRLLAGGWKAEASAGSPAGSCAFRFELGGHILVRTNHAETLPRGNTPAGTHNDLMVISPGTTGAQALATYWDNEGHLIEYSAGWSTDGNTLTFLSKPGPGPQFRLIYKKVDSDTFSVSFDMAPPGQSGAFKTYTSGRIRRQK